MIELVGYRWADWDTPLWIDENRNPGRWHAVGDGSTQYWALHPLGPWAERARMEGIRSAADLEGIASRTWAAEFHFEADELERISFDNATRFGLEAADLIADDHSECRKLAQRLRRNVEAIVVPSAALPGTENLIVFGQRAMSPYGAEPPDRLLDVPSAVTADAARPPDVLLNLVSHIGSTHWGYREWELGNVLPPPSIPYDKP